MQSEREKWLLDLFKTQMIEPITKLLEEKSKSAIPSGEELHIIESAMEPTRTQFLNHIDRSLHTSPVRNLKNDELTCSPPDLSSPKSELEGLSSLKSDGASSPPEVAPNALSSNNGNQKEMSSTRRRPKRSLEDTVQKLSDEKTKLQSEPFAAKRASPPRRPSPPTLSPHPSAITNTAPILFPTVIPPLSIARWMGTSSAPMPVVSSPLYLNAMNMLHSQNMLTSYLTKIGMQQHHAHQQHNLVAESLKESTLSARETPEQNMDDVKIEVDSSDDSETSPSPSSGGGDTSCDFSETSTHPSNDSICADNESEKPYVCEHKNCYKRFANKFLLKKHQFIHTGLRPHQCPFCSKKFNRKDNLLRHKKTHLGAIEAATATSLTAKNPLSQPLAGFPSSPFVMDSIKIDNFKFQLELAKMANPQLFDKDLSDLVKT